MTSSTSERKDLERFAVDVYQDVVIRATSVGGEEYLESEFTQRTFETLSEAGEIDDEWAVAYHCAKGMKATGYGINLEQDVLIIATTIFTAQRPPRTVGKNDVAGAFKRARTFLERIATKSLVGLEESSSSFEMVDQISAWLPNVKQVRFYLFTDGLVPEMALPDETIGKLEGSYHVWDLRRLYRCETSGQVREEVNVDLAQLANGSLPYLKMPASTPEYSCYLLMIPGDVLAQIYSKFGTRLLERNVRAFLQARGKVNKGIRATILSAPDRFLAYNNGISATAAAVTFARGSDGTDGIESLRDFQIVNGGQTTASLYNALVRDRAQLASIAVQAKLTVVEPNLLDELVPLISRYANSQNKVNEADFFANDLFHVSLEKLSRTQWTPAPPGQQRQTRWFYERARGQYADALGGEGTASRRKQFQAIFPPRQRFTKTDLAKYENCWNQLPHFVARGAEKNFREFTINAADRNATSPTEQYFFHLVAKALLFREAEARVSAMALGGYRSQVVAYSIALLSHASAMRLDLEQIWKEQSVPPEIVEAIDGIIPLVHSSLTAPPGGQNIAEWCKKKDCWEVVKALPISLPESLMIALSGRKTLTPKSNPSHISEVEAEDLLLVVDIPSEVWFALAQWAKETMNLAPWQRGLAFSLGRLSSREQRPSPKQARQGVKILQEAKRLGFSEALVTS